MLKILPFVLIALLALPAEAQIYAPTKDPTTCVSARQGWGIAGNAPASANNYETCSPVNIGDGSPYKGLRVDPGMAAVPHEIYGSCFYIDNYTDKSFFIPAATPAEWASFVDNHPQLINLVPCCRPDIAVQSDDTCNEPLTRVDYQRPGYSLDEQVGTFQARAVSLQCVLSNNGRSAQWDLQADTATACDANLAAAAPAANVRPRIYGAALIRNIPIGEPVVTD